MKRLSIIFAILTLYGCANSNSTLKLANDLDKEQQWSIEDIKPADEYFDKGLKYNLENNDSTAIIYYDSAIMLNIETSYYNNRGASKLTIGDTIGAMYDYYEALKIDSLDYIALTNIGHVYFEQKNYNKALHHFNQSEKLSATQSGIYYRLGNCEYILKDYRNALKHFELHTKSKYNLHLDYTFYMMGNCHEKLNEIQVAEVYWKKAAEMEYEDAITKMDSLKNLKK